MRPRVRLSSLRMSLRVAPFSLAFALFVAVGATAQDASPGLAWEQTIVQLETDGTSSPQETVFRFRNNGPRPVVIRSVNTSCGCTVGSPDKTHYAPGESGVLPVKHKPKPGTGVRAYRINVRTDEGGGREHILTLQVTNNPRVTIQPRVINWAKDESRTPKNIDIRLKKDDVLKITGAQATPDVLDIAVTDGPEPGRQTLVVTPKPGTGLVPGRVRVQLTTEPPTPPSMDTQFFAVLR
ncbi:MAG: DUF1573 domain-containing protein [Chthoniobacterales bacterium]|nr:DUF1573 domain-containing protein [Chthoniobacterales bacterium]